MKCNVLLLIFLLWNGICCGNDMKRVILLPGKVELMLYSFPIYVGTPQQYRLFDIDLKEQFNHFSFTLPNSSSFHVIDKNEMIIVKDTQYIYDLIHEKVRISKDNNVIEVNSLLKFYNFLSSFDTDNSLTFAFDIKDKEHSLLHALFTQNEITILSFGLFQDKTGKVLDLYLGGFPTTMISSMKVFVCPVNLSYSSWGCTLNKVIVDSNNDNEIGVYINRDKSYFQSRRNQIYTPISFWNEFKAKYLDDYVKKNICENKYVYYFYCDNNIVDIFPKISFVFESTIITIDNKYLFRKIGNKKELLIFPNENNSCEWELGVGFMMAFPMEFNYETSSISFYSNNTFKSEKEYLKTKSIIYLNSNEQFNVQPSFNISMWLIELNIIFILIGIGIVIYKKYFQSENIKKCPMKYNNKNVFNK